MKLEEFGAPLPNESPERRYASLHRTIEAGHAKDKTWSDLVHTCLTLHKPDEALAAAGYIDDPVLRERAQRLLLAEGAHGRKKVKPATETRMQAPPRPAQIVESEDSIIESVVDSFRFLFLDQMPLTVIFATLTFPLVVGLGGFLTRDSHAVLFPLIAMIPALSVVGLIGALGRRITLDACQGLDDPPVIPPIRELSRDALRFLVDAAVLGAVFLGPGIICLSVETVGVAAALTTLALGVFLLPMAMGIRQMTSDWRALSPNVLFPAIVRGGQDYAAVAITAAVLFTPAGLSAWFSAGSQIYLQVSVVGPLMVAPLFVIARLLGQTMHHRRHEMRQFFGIPEKPAERIVSAAHMADSTRHVRESQPQTAAAAAKPARPVPLHKGNAHPEAQRAPKVAAKSKPAAKPRATQAPNGVPRAQPVAASVQGVPGGQRPVAAARAAANTAPAPISQSATAASPKPFPKRNHQGTKSLTNQQARPAPIAKAAEPAPQTRVELQEVRSVGTAAKDSLPDLSNIPGAHVVKGEDRVRAGAASTGTNRGR